MFVQPLFTPIRMGNLELPKSHRSWRRLLRMRAGPIDHVANRAASGILCSARLGRLDSRQDPAIAPTASAGRIRRACGVRSRCAGWRRVTNAVHAAAAE